MFGRYIWQPFWKHLLNMWTQMCVCRYIWQPFCKCHLNMWTQMCGGLYLGMLSENLNSFQVWLLLHRGLFYERPKNTITTWKKRADKILKNVGHLSNKRKLNKISPYRDMQFALLYWWKEMQLRDHPLTKEVLQLKANR